MTSSPTSSGLFARLQQCAERYKELEAQSGDPELHKEPGRLASLLREMGALREKAETFATWSSLAERREAAEVMLKEESDADIVSLARDELTEVLAEQKVMVEAARRHVADDDPNRGRDVLVEVRAGAGGDEASLFAANLVRVYGKFCESHGLKFQILSSSVTEVGGYKEVVVSVTGEAAWDLLRYESGGHRVQRVPETESQGRIHTSAATVAVLPEADEVDVDMDEADLRIDTYRASGPGGQNVNKTSSAVRITHVPTGTVVQCQDESSQHKNKARALRMLRTRMKDAADQAARDIQAAERRTQIGSGDRSERIRTYNYPQNRVTDHRIKTNYTLETVMLGRLDDIVGDLRERDLEMKLAALGEGVT
ncbi:MAG: peptide chain release factor 1 [Pseudohongiellaceae bacterium]|jgi:peptide chain release factor 1